MTIDGVEVIPVRLPNRIPLKLATGVLEHQDNVIVRLRAGRLAGLGETQPLDGFQGCTESQATIVPLIRERLAPVLLGRSPFEVERIVRDMEAAGPGVGFRFEANGAFGFDQPLALLRDLSPFKLELVEQPLGLGDLDGMARLVELAGVPIMPDESLHSPASALELVRRRAASIFGMKLAKHGGIYGAQRIAAIAQAASLPIYPGGQPGTSVGSATAAHFYAATWNASLGGDFHVGPAGWLADGIGKRPLVVKDG